MNVLCSHYSEISYRKNTKPTSFRNDDRLLSFWTCIITTIYRNSGLKHNRPVAAGRVTANDAVIFYIIWCIIYLLLSSLIGFYCIQGIKVIIFSFGWVICAILHSHEYFALSRFWYFKHGIMAYGYFVLLYQPICVCSAFNVIDKIDLYQMGQWMNTVNLYNVWLPILLYFTIHAQDFRDINNDKKVNRRTLPILMKSNSIYKFCGNAMYFVAMIITHYLLLNYYKYSKSNMTYLLYFCIHISLCLVYTLLYLQKQYQRFYKVYILTFVYFEFSIIFIM